MLLLLSGLIEYANGNKSQWYIDRFESGGFKYDDDLYKEVVEHSLMERKNHESGSYTWLERTGMVFKNTMLIGSQTESFEDSESESVEEVEDGGTFE